MSVFPVKAVTNTVTLISQTGLTNSLRLMLSPNNFDTNTIPFALTNVGATSIPVNPFQFEYIGGNLTLVQSLPLTNTANYGASVAVHFESMANSTNALIAGTGAGTSPTITVESGGTDHAFNVTVLTGTGTSTSSGIFTNTFNLLYSATPSVCFSPANFVTASLASTANKQPYVIATTTGFTFMANSVSLTDSTTYKWNFIIAK